MFTVQLLFLLPICCSSYIIQSWFRDYQRGISVLDMLFPFHRAVSSVMTNSLLLPTTTGEGVSLSFSLSEVGVQFSADPGKANMINTLHQCIYCRHTEVRTDCRIKWELFKRRLSLKTLEEHLRVHTFPCCLGRPQSKESI